MSWACHPTHDLGIHVPLMLDLIIQHKQISKEPKGEGVNVHAQPLLTFYLAISFCTLTDFKAVAFLYFLSLNIYPVILKMISHETKK